MEKNHGKEQDASNSLLAYWIKQVVFMSLTITLMIADTIVR